MNFKSLIPMFAFVALFSLEGRGQSTPKQDSTTAKVDTVYVRDTVYVPVPVGDTSQEQIDPSTRRFVSQQAIDEVAANGVDNVYYLARVGYTEGLASTGEHVGIEFRIWDNGFAVPARAFNLDNPDAAQKFDNAKSNADLRELDLSMRAGTYVLPDAYPYYPQPVTIINVGWPSPTIYVMPGGTYNNNNYGPGYNNGGYNNNGNHYNNHNNNYNNGNNGHNHNGHGRGHGRRH